MRRSIAIAILTVLAFAGGCTDNKPVRQLLDATGDYVEVIFAGKRFYGQFLKFRFEEQGNVTLVCSSVILMPWDKRPTKCSVRLEQDGTTIAMLSGTDYRFKGRLVGITDERGLTLTLNPGEVPLEAYKDRASLEKAVTEILTNPKHDNASSASQPIEPGINRTSSEDDSHK